MSAERLTVMLTGLEVFGRHGVLAAENQLGQRFVVDLAITLAHADASHSDVLSETVNYAGLADAVAAIVAGRPVALLERLAGMIADRVLTEPHVAEVSVTVRKPHVAIPHTVAESAVNLRRTR